MLLDSGDRVLVQVSGAGPGGVDRVGRGNRVVAGAAQTLQQALHRTRPALSAVMETARGLAEPPRVVTVEFGISLSAEVGVVVARGTTEANFAVSMEWTSSPASADGPESTDATGAC
ncbi:CU044_2847 family protein [Streptomyces sp. NPDC057301]|uniref:CU044_2847 family protein n=1 Tax=Streptomyces sp. NPDC057301 TaxID=3346093 RepID=UPI003633D6A3